MKPPVLLAEDDPNLGELLQDYLNAKGFDVSLAINGEEAFDLFCSKKFDICILDVMMPKKDGFSVAKDIRLHNDHIPILFLTAKAMKEDTLKGFEVGGDDYLTKPFLMEELLLRIKAILKRSSGQSVKEMKDHYTIGKYTLDMSRRELTLEGIATKLTTKEAALLGLFSQHANQAVSRTYALKMIWGDDSYFNARSMDVYITKLRKYLKGDPKVKILNLHGEGFKLIM
jgi:DNA-binding response OmpR family regulator